MTRYTQRTHSRGHKQHHAQHSLGGRLLNLRLPYSKNCFIRHWINRKSRLTGKLTRVKLNLEQGIKEQKGSRGIALLLNLGARWGGWSVPASTNKDVLYLPVEYMSKQIPGLRGRALSIGFSTLISLGERIFSQEWNASRQEIHTVTSNLQLTLS
jgi:hypothetical protein